MNRLKPKDGEDDGACVDGGEGVAGGDDDDVLDAVLGWVVVTAKADDGAESKAKGVKDLGGCADMSAGAKLYLVCIIIHQALFPFASASVSRKKNQMNLIIEKLSPDLLHQARLWGAGACPSWG